MKPTTPIYCLALHPQAVEFNEQQLQRLQQHLSELGLLGETFDMQGEQYYKLGERFYQLLSFMGCAPALKLEPDGPEDEKFCHFRFIQPPHLVFRSLRAGVKARCPHCRKAGTTADEIRQGYFLQQQDWFCPHCQMPSPVQDINWNHEAGMGQFFLELVDVYPHEVIPTDSLLKELETVTGQGWQYFYTAI